MPSQSASKSTHWILKCLKYFPCVFFGKFRCSGFTTVKAWMIVPTLFRRIPHIVSIRAKKQVLHPDAGGVVAFVKAVKPIRNWAATQDPRRPVRFDLASSMYSFFNITVALGVSGSRPQPAPVRLLDLGKKSFYKRGRKILTGEKCGRNFVVHLNHILGCQASGCFSSAGATSFNGSIFFTRSQEC